MSFVSRSFDVPGEGGVAPAGAAGQVPGPDGAGVDLMAVVDQHLRVVGDEDLLGAPAVEDLGGLRPVREAGEDLRLRRVGLQEADIGQHLFFLRPVVVHHAAVLHPAEHGLHVDGHHGVLGGVGDHLIGDVAPHQTRQMPDGRVDLGHLLGPVGLDDAVHRGGPPLPVRRVVDVLGDEGGLAVEGVDGHIGGRGKGSGQIHLAGVPPWAAPRSCGRCWQRRSRSSTRRRPPPGRWCRRSPHWCPGPPRR